MLLNVASRPRSQPRESRRRHNPRSAWDTPPGFFLCPHATCSLLLPDKLLEQEVATCGRGHSFDPRTHGSDAGDYSGGWTHVGITCTQQGDLGEQIIEDLHDLGEYGRINWSGDYHSPIDFGTDRKWGVEVKSISTRASNLHFSPYGRASSRKRKDDFVREQGWQGIVGALVILNYGTSKADVYLRAMKKLHYFERPDEPFRRGVPFVNPFDG